MNLNWARVKRSNYACLDERDPVAQRMPHPADTNWKVRSDNVHNIKNRCIPIRLAEDQLNKQNGEVAIGLKGGSSASTLSPEIVLQRARDRNINLNYLSPR